MEHDNTILIISQKNEQSTDKVLQYLLYCNMSFIRINEDDRATTASVTFNNKDNFNITYNNCIIDLSKIHSTWYRRGKINLLKNILCSFSNEEYQLYQKYYENSYLKEVDDIMKYIYQELINKKHINMFYDNYISKVVQLKTAIKNELKVPKTIITDSIKTVLDYFEGFEIIYKSIHWNIFNFSTKEGSNYNASMESSKLVKKEELIALMSHSEKFQYSLFQEYIKKKFELRIFYLNGKFFPMAIFSQQSEETKIDWRNDNFINRTSTFKLPESIEIKISNFMNDLNLNCGSLDFIYTPTGEYIFLEVNPIGQFDWLSSGCNYFIEKHIANELRR